MNGINPKGNSTNPSNWDFGSSFFFAGTVVTTIGKWERSEASLGPAELGVHSKCHCWSGNMLYPGGDRQGTGWEVGRLAAAVVAWTHFSGSH